MLLTVLLVISITGLLISEGFGDTGGNGFSVFLLYAIACLYVYNDYWGIRLIQKLKNNQSVPKEQKNRITALFIVQFLFQLISAVQIISNINEIIYRVTHPSIIINSGFFSSFIGTSLFTIFFLTIYYEIFTMSLIRFVTLNYEKTVIRPLNDMGQT